MRRRYAAASRRRVRPPGSWPSPSPASGPARCPVDEDGRPGRRLRPVEDTRGAPYVDERRRRDRVSGYAPRPLATWLRRTRRHPDDVGRRPRRPHPLPRSTTQPEVLRAARWYLEPVDYLTMRFTGVAAASPASMTGGLAHRQPHARPRWRTTTCWCALAGVDASQAAAARRHRVGRSGRCARRSPPSSASPPAAVVVTGAARPALRRGRRGRDRPTTSRTCRSAPRRGSARRCRSRRPTSSGMQATRARASTTRRTCSPTTRTTAGRNLQWWRDTVAPGIVVRRPAGRGRRDRRRAPAA